MLPLESSPSQPEALPPGPDQEKSSVAQKADGRRLSRIYIATILAAGLLIAAGYVSTRIFSGSQAAKPKQQARVSQEARPGAPAPAAAVSTPAEKPPAPEVAEPSAKTATPEQAAIEKPISEKPINEKPAAEKPTTELAITQKPDEKPIQVQVTVSKTEEPPARFDVGSLANPQHGERYLQVAALSSPTVARYLSELRGYQLQPVVAPGPRPGIDRVLLGPFLDRESLESVRTRLQELGAECFIRVY